MHQGSTRELCDSRLSEMNLINFTLSAHRRVLLDRNFHVSSQIGSDVLQLLHFFISKFIVAVLTSQHVRHLKSTQTMLGWKIYEIWKCSKTLKYLKPY